MNIASSTIIHFPFFSASLCSGHIYFRICGEPISNLCILSNTTADERTPMDIAPANNFASPNTRTKPIVMLLADTAATIEY